MWCTTYTVSTYRINKAGPLTSSYLYLLCCKNYLKVYQSIQFFLCLMAIRDFLVLDHIAGLMMPDISWKASDTDGGWSSQQGYFSFPKVTSVRNWGGWACCRADSFSLGQTGAGPSLDVFLQLSPFWLPVPSEYPPIKEYLVLSSKKRAYSMGSSLAICSSRFQLCLHSLQYGYKAKLNKVNSFWVIQVKMQEIEQAETDVESSLLLTGGIALQIFNCIFISWFCPD